MKLVMDIIVSGKYPDCVMSNPFLTKQIWRQCEASIILELCS